MATRLYLSAATTATPVTPGFDGSWTSNTGAVRRNCGPTKQSSTMTTSATISVASGAGNHGLCVQFISPPMAAQTISGTVSAIMMEAELATNDNIDRPWMSIRVVQSDGTTIRGTVLTLANQTGANNTEILTTQTVTTFANGASLSSLSVSAGDRLVIEMGYGLSATGTSPQFALRWGESAASDGTVGTNGSTTDINGFVEFSMAIKWAYDQTLTADAVTVSDSLVDNSEFGRVLSDTVSVADAFAGLRFDPTTLNWSSYYRPDTVQYNGAPWTPTTSAGSSGTNGNLAQDGTNNVPSNGTAVQGFVPAKFISSSTQRFLADWRGSNVFTAATAGSFVMFVKPLNLPTSNADPRKNAAIVTDTEGYDDFGITISADGVYGYYNPDQGSAGNGRVTDGGLDTSQYHRIVMRWNSTVLSLKVDNRAEVTQALSTTTFDWSWPVILGHDQLGTNFLDLEMLEFGTIDGRIADADITNYDKYLVDRYGQAIPSGGGQTYSQTFPDTSLAVTDSLLQAAVYSQTFSDSLSVTDSITREQQRDLGTDALTVTDTLLETTTYGRTFSDAIAVTDALLETTTFGQTFSDAIVVTDAANGSLELGVTFSDAVSVTDSLAETTTFGQTFSDTLSITDALVSNVEYLRALTDAVSVTDAITREQQRDLGTDAVSVTEQFDYVKTGGQTYSQTFSDTTEAVTDALVQTVQYERVFSDAVAVTDALSYSTSGTIFQSFADTSETVTDSITAQIYATYSQTQSDVSESVTDALTQTVQYNRTLNDTVAVTDAITREQSRVIGSDAVAVTDSLLETTTFGRILDDATTGLSTTDALSVAQVLARTVSDVVSVTDQIDATTAGTFSVTFSDTVSITDALAQEFDQSQSMSDSISTTDSIVVSIEYCPSFIDNIVVTDDVVGAAAYAPTYSDAVDVADDLVVLLIEAHVPLHADATMETIFSSVRAYVRPDPNSEATIEIVLPENHPLRHLMSDFTIKQGDTLPTLSAILKVGGVIDPGMVNITGVKLVLVKRSTPDVFFFVGNAVVVSVPNGQVAYYWQANDTATPGEYYAEWHVTYTGGAKRTFPTVGRFQVSIEAALPETAPP